MDITIDRELLVWLIETAESSFNYGEGLTSRHESPEIDRARELVGMPALPEYGWPIGPDPKYRITEDGRTRAVTREEHEERYGKPLVITREDLVNDRGLDRLIGFPPHWRGEKEGG